MGTNLKPDERGYWCFISYRHADNKDAGRQWATWLHHVIETYEVPQDLVGKMNDRGDTIPERIYPVFRDEEELPVDADLASPIYRALDASKTLVVICSPRAVASRYIGDEITYFKRLGRQERVLAVMIEGEPNASRDEAKAAQGIKPTDECFPEALRLQLTPDGSLLAEPVEPIAADFRLGISQGWTSPEAYRLALRREGTDAASIQRQVDDYRKTTELMKLKVIAGILGVPLGILTERDKTYQLALAKKRAKTLRRWLMVVGLLALLAMAAGVYAWWSQGQAREQRALAIHAAEVAETQRTLAVQNADRAEAQRKKAIETLSQSYYLQSLELGYQRRNNEALAALACAIRENPQNRAALDELYLSLFSQNSWPVQTAPPMHHDSPVFYASFSQDGRRLLTVAKDARLWDVQTGLLIGAPMHHDQFVRKAIFSPDGSLILTTAFDHTARLWDAHTARPICAPLVQDNPGVNIAVFSPDSSRVAVGSVDSFSGIARIWDTFTGQPIGMPMVHKGQIESISFSPDGSRLATASDDGTARLWDAHTGKPLGAPMIHQDIVWTVDFSPDGASLVTSSKDDTGRIWDGHDGHPLGPVLREANISAAMFNGSGLLILTMTEGTTSHLWTTFGRMVAEMPNASNILNFNVSADRSYLVTKTVDNRARLWNLNDGTAIGPVFTHGESKGTASFTLDNSRIVVCSGPDTAQIWDVRTMRAIGEPIRTPSLSCASISPDGSHVATGSLTDAVRIWEARDAHPMVATMDNIQAPAVGHENNLGGDIDAASFGTSSDQVFLVSRNHVVQRWDLRSGLPVNRPIEMPEDETSAHLSPDGSILVTDSTNGSVRILDLGSAHQIGGPILNSEFSGFSPDGNLMLTVSPDNEARIWDARTGRSIGNVIQHKAKLSFSSFNADGTRLLTADDRTARVWDVQSTKEIGEAVSMDDEFHSGALSPDGTRLLISSGDTAQLWDAATGRPLGEVMNPGNGTVFASFSPDGTRVLTISQNSAQLWNSSSGLPMGRVMNDESYITSANFSPDGVLLVTAADDNTVRVYDAHTGQSIAVHLRHGHLYNKDDMLLYPVDSAVFSPDGSRILTRANGNVFCWDLFPPIESAPPAWLPDLAEAVGGLAISGDGSPQPVDPQRLFQLKAMLADSSGDDFWGDAGRWFFADRDSRFLSPETQITLSKYRARQADATK
jgi:WD40 repeat protein